MTEFFIQKFKNSAKRMKHGILMSVLRSRLFLFWLMIAVRKQQIFTNDSMLPVFTVSYRWQNIQMKYRRLYSFRKT